MDVVRALERAVDGHPAVLGRHRDHRVVLDVQLLLVADAVLAFEDQVCGRERRLRVAAGQLVGRERMVRFERIEDRRQRLGPGVDGGPRGPERGPIGGREEGQRLGVVADLATHRDQDRLVLLDRADDVVAGDVRRGHDDDRRPVEGGVEVERHEPGVRVGRADGGAEPGPGEDQVVGVLGGAGQLGRTLASQGAGATGTTGRDRAGLDDDRVGRLGPARQVGQGPSSIAADSITGRRADGSARDSHRTLPDRIAR